MPELRPAYAEIVAAVAVGCRSTRRTAFTARPATLKTRTNINWTTPEGGSGSELSEFWRRLRPGVSTCAWLPLFSDCFCLVELRRCSQTFTASHEPFVDARRNIVSSNEFLCGFNAKVQERHHAPLQGLSNYQMVHQL